ncbi:hypothetical protein [Methanoculleus sp. UBA303]|uniref:hypothetical protein n=1 Tax=Methanoculleus sp. UBA303 TaxID=1915497 RepID=UPI0025DDC98E|nr:hypothetical protein [Methanoculleus sp. UBA303]
MPGENWEQGRTPLFDIAEQDDISINGSIHDHRTVFRILVPGLGDVPFLQGFGGRISGTDGEEIQKEEGTKNTGGDQEENDYNPTHPVGFQECHLDPPQ